MKESELRNTVRRFYDAVSDGEVNLRFNGEKVEHYGWNVYDPETKGHVDFDMQAVGKVLVDRDLLRKVLAAMEEMESKIEGEWGWCRPLEELVAKGKVPLIVALREIVS